MDSADTTAGPYVWQRPVPTHLGGMVESITGYAEGGVALRGVMQPASVSVPLVITFVDAFHIRLGDAARERWSSFTSGIFAGPVEISSNGRSECIQVDFTPLGARRFFGLPMSEISGRMVAIDDIAPEFQHLRERLGDTPSWKTRLAMAEAFVSGRLACQPRARADVARAWRHLVAGNGNVRVEAVAADLGISRKHLAALFRDHIGLGPKAAARILRFNAVLAEAGRGESDWAGIAAGCGYADQAHLSREFQALAGCAPGAWAG